MGNSSRSDSSISGWAFVCDESSAQKWRRVFLKCAESKLELYRTPEASTPLSSIALSEASLREVTLGGLLPHGVASHARGLILTTSSSREESPRAIFDLRASSLDLPDGADAPQLTVDLLLACEDSVQQDAWTRVLKDRVASATLLPPGTVNQLPSFTPVAVAAPPPDLLRWLAADAATATSLADSLHAAHTALLASQRAGAVLTSDPIASVHAPLAELERCFTELHARVVVGSANGGSFESLGPVEAAAARVWLQNAKNYCRSCSDAARDALIGEEGASDLGSFSATAMATAASFESAETALIDEIARQKRAKLAAETGMPEGRLLAVGRVRPSAQPYARFWAKKIAV